MPQPSHASLCTLAAAWVKRPLGKGGHACQVAFVEPRVSFMAGECPDAIGFRVSERHGGSVLVECKVSRADFFADTKKPHRLGNGMGRWRYYLCPEGMVAPEEVPAGWGLLYAGPGNRISAVLGAAAHAGQPGRGGYIPSEALDAMAVPHDARRETLLLANLLHRVGDPEALNRRLRAADGLSNRLSKHAERLEGRLRKCEHDLLIAKFG